MFLIGVLECVGKKFIEIFRRLRFSELFRRLPFNEWLRLIVALVFLDDLARRVNVPHVFAVFRATSAYLEVGYRAET